MIKHKAIMIGAGLAQLFISFRKLIGKVIKSPSIHWMTMVQMMVPQQSILWMNIGTKIIPWKTRRAMLLGAVGC